MPIPAAAIYETVAPHVGEAGTCDETLFLRALNQALDLIWNLGDWEGTIVRCRLPVGPDCCLRLPWQIEKIRTAWFDGRDVPVGDHLYETLNSNSISGCQSCDCPRLINLNIQRPLPVEVDWPKYLAVQFGPEDAGTKVTLTYKDASGVTKRFDAVAEANCGSGSRHITTEQVHGLLMVSKAETKYPVSLLACADSKCASWERVAYYHPTQMYPSYSLIKVVGPPNSSIVVRGKLRRPRIVSMEDMVPIENAHALALAVRAVSSLGRNRDAYVAHLKDATDLLKLEALDELDTSGADVDVVTPYAYNLMPNR